MLITVVAAGTERRIEAEPGENLLAALARAGVPPVADCGGRGRCGKCAVLTRTAGADGDERALACRTSVAAGMVVTLLAPGEADVRRKVGLAERQAGQAPDDAPVRKRFLRLDPPGLADQRPDLERLLDRLGPDRAVSLDFARDLPRVLRASDFAATAVFSADRLIALEPGNTEGQGYGFVFDIGTTTIAGYLIHLYSGETLAARGADNPQRRFGADVLSRIAAAGEDADNTARMQALTLDCVGDVMRELLRQAGVAESAVYSLVVTGNTTMSHLVLGIDPRNLALAPFIPCLRRAPALRGRDLGLPMHPDGTATVLPISAGYLGSDILSVALATDLDRQAGYSLAVDIGTNAEIILAGGGRLVACAAAAGPAFEGAHIEQGMRAGRGAIEAVRIDGDAVHLDVIDQAAPQGLCGSGLIDAAAALLGAGILDRRGRLADGGGLAPALAARLRPRADGIREFVLCFAGEADAPADIVLTQKDVRELQLAKGAVAAGIRILAETLGIDTAAIDRVFLAGAFGNYIDRAHAAALGMFPGIAPEKISPVGNAAGEGARRCLLSERERRRLDRLADEVRAVELSTCPAFNDIFVRELGFPPPHDDKEEPQ